MKIELLEIFGDDNMVANAARVSYDKKASDYTEHQNEKLLKFLAEHNHWSPFSHPKLQYRIQIPIYVERQLIKTKCGVEFNSLSGRYIDFSDTYTCIEEWRKQSKSSKQGSEGLIENQDLAFQIENEVIEKCKKSYDNLIELGVSKEQARTVLPLSLNTTMIWTGSLYAFIRLCKQRMKPDAQKETGDVVREMLTQLKNTNKFSQSLAVYNL